MLALLDWRNSPTPVVKTSPVQRLMSKRTKSLLPIDSKLLYPKVVDNVQNDVLCKSAKSKKSYDRNCMSLPVLRKGDVVRVQPLNRNGTWEMGKCIKQVAPRSYLIESNGRVIRRNRRFLKITNEPYVPFDFSFDSCDGDVNNNNNADVNPLPHHRDAEPPISLRRTPRECGPPKRYG